MKKKNRLHPYKYKYDAREWDEAKSEVVVPEKRIKRTVSTRIELSPAMVNKLRKVAEKKRDLGYQALIKLWVLERLEKELKKKAG